MKDKNVQGEWLLENAKKDTQSITSDWIPENQQLIEGVKIKEIKNVIKENGYLTEVYRKDWDLDEKELAQVFQVMLNPQGISAWHAHEFTTDRLFVNLGTIKIVLYDARQDSPTFGKINVFKTGELRPQLIVVPPKIWHGIQNISEKNASILNLVDKAYQYENPDHWRIPQNSELIPYQFN